MKLKDKKGLTLVEMLCTVAILVLVSMVMVLGVQLGVRSYAKSVSYSEAQVLCSTLTTTISDELRYSGTLKVDGSGSVTGFFSQQFGSGDYKAQCDDRRHRRGPRPRRRHPQYRKLRNTAPNGMLRRRGVFAIKNLYTLCFKKYDFMRFFLHVKSKYDKIEIQCI